MDKEFPTPNFALGARRGPRTRFVLLAVLAAFLLGAGAVGWLAWKGDLPFAAGPQRSGQVPLAGEAPGPATLADLPATPESQAEQTAQEVEQVAEMQGGMEARISGMEQRLARLDLQSQAVSGNAARAEGLLIAFAARRAVERGENLGWLEDQIELRFGAADPAAVRAIIAASQEPVTTDQLVARLDELAPRLTQEVEQGVSWSWFKRQVSEMFIIRKDTTPSPLPHDRLARARSRLQAGAIDAAIASVQQLPGAPAAAGWIKDASRYGAAIKALERLEQKAILEPRELRDSGGQKVEQPSPADIVE
jgi:hypothetical protein